MIDFIFMQVTYTNYICMDTLHKILISCRIFLNFFFTFLWGKMYKLKCVKWLQFIIFFMIHEEPKHLRGRILCVLWTFIRGMCFQSNRSKCFINFSCLGWQITCKQPSTPKAENVSALDLVENVFNKSMALKRASALLPM